MPQIAELGEEKIAEVRVKASSVSALSLEFVNKKGKVFCSMDTWAGDKARSVRPLPLQANHRLVGIGTTELGGLCFVVQTL